MQCRCLITLALPQTQETLNIDCNQLIIGDDLNAHLWLGINFYFSIRLDPNQQPLLESPKKLTINERAQTKARLKPGDKIYINRKCTLVYAGRRDRHEFIFNYQGPAPTLPGQNISPKNNKRAMFVFLLPILMLGLISLPFWLPQFSDLPTQAHNPELSRSAAPPSHPLENWLSTGDLHPAHQSFACAECHIKDQPFTPNQACFSCHTMDRHFSREKTGAHPNCVSCHLEHNEPNNLIEKDERLCSQCHGDMDQVAATLSEGTVHTLQAFKSFEQGHPEFSEATTRQTFHFNHQEHLSPNLLSDKQDRSAKLTSTMQLVLSADGGLACGQCHTLTKGEPALANFNDSCQACHELKDQDGRTLVHGDLAQLALQLQTHTQGDDDWQVQGLARINGDTCGLCHKAKLEGFTPLDFNNAMVDWQLTSNKMNARFAHKKHEGKLSCAQCHQAEQSTQAIDNLYPQRSTCLDCHNDKAPKPLRACASCHQFHRAPWPNR